MLLDFILLLLVAGFFLVSIGLIKAFGKLAGEES